MIAQLPEPFELSTDVLTDDFGPICSVAEVTVSCTLCESLVEFPRLSQRNWGREEFTICDSCGMELNVWRRER